MGALKVGSVRHIVCAAHSFTDWRFKNTQTIRVKPRLTVTSNDVAIEAAKQGLGITRLLSYQVVESLAAGDLKIVLEDFEPPSLPVSIVHREGRFASSKVRSFIDLMAQRLRDDKALN
jgi:DNA-binding transcriptional LysR family regulator